MPNDGQVVDPNLPQNQTQPVSPTQTQAQPQRQAFSALEDDPDTRQDIEEPDDPDMDLAVSFMAQPNNPEWDPSAQGDEGDTPPNGQTQPQQAVTPGAPQGVAPQGDPAQAPVVPAAGQPQQTVTPPQAPQAQPQAQPPAPVVNPSDAFRVLNETIEQKKGEIAGLLAGQTYQLSSQELEGIQSEPEKVLPQLMAKVHLNAVQGVLRHVAQQLPAAVSSMIQAHAQNQRLEDQFYSAWPQLNRYQHDSTVRQMAYMFRQMNPSASMEDMIRTVGAQVVTALGLPAQTQPAAQPQRVVRQQQPFRPAAPAQASPGPAPARTPNEWERMASYIALDDAGRFEAN